MSGRRRALAQWAIAIALVVVVVSRFDLRALADRLVSVDLWLAVPAIAGLVAVHLVGAVAWRRLHARLAGARLGWSPTIRLYYTAQAIGSLTPAGVGADVYRFATVDAQASRSAAALPIVVQRLTGIMALLAVGGIGLLALPIAAGTSVALTIALGLGLVLALGSALAAWARWGGRIVERFVPSLAGREAEPIGRGAWAAAVRDGFVLGLAFHALSIALGVVLVAAVDAPAAARPVEVAAALAVARLSLAIPISPSGLGIQEGVLAILFVQLGLPADVALAALLLNRVALVILLLGGAIAILSGAGRAQQAPVTVETPVPRRGTRRPPATAGPG